MSANFSCCFCIAKPEESPCLEINKVVELDTRSAAEAPSTSGRSEYSFARCEAMMRSRGSFSDDVVLEIEFSKSHWSEVNRRGVEPQSTEEEELNRENRELCRQLGAEHPLLFRDDLERFVMGRLIARGGQAEIYEVVGNPSRLLKVFKRGTSLRDLRGSCPLPVLNEDVRQCIRWAGLLKDGRFAFVMKRFWGDLRKLIDQAMEEKNVHGIQGLWKDSERWNFQPIDFMYEIARGMQSLHEKGVSHRDLKASNILLNNDLEYMNTNMIDLRMHGLFGDLITIADFECSIGVWGTGYWRAPEILASLEKQETLTNEQWKKADVYSYGMTCFEIVTCRIPFDGELQNTKVDRQLVIDGKRPQLPSNLDELVKDLITKCWEPNPSLRPTFIKIVDMVKTISTKECQFRLFGIGDESPPQYLLTSIQEVNEYTIAL